MSKRILVSLAAAALIAALAAWPAQAAFVSPSGVTGSGWINVPAAVSPAVSGDPSVARVVPVGTTLAWNIKDVISLPAELQVDSSPTPGNATACQLRIAAIAQKFRREDAGLWWLDPETGTTIRGYTSATSAAVTSVGSENGIGTAWTAYQQAKIDATFDQPGLYAIAVGLSSSLCTSGSGNVTTSDGRQIVAKYLVQVKSAADYARPETGWYYDVTQGGRGFAVQIYPNNRAFVGIFGYDATGAATWQVADGTYDPSTRVFTGTRKIFRGGATLGDAVGSTASEVGSPGTISITWDPINAGYIGGGNRNAVIYYGNVGRRITRYPVPESGETVVGGAVDLSKGAGLQTGWYWDPRSGGRGYFVETTRVAGTNGAQVATFAVAFMYRADGSPVWYTFQGLSTGTVNPRLLETTMVEWAGGTNIETNGNQVWQTPTSTVSRGAATLGMATTSNSLRLPGTGSTQALVPYVLQ